MTDDMARAARALHVAGNGGFRAVVEAELDKAEEKNAAQMRAAIPGGLPRRGGLAALVAADASFDVHSASGGSDVVVVTTAVRSQYNIARMNDAGSFSHPVYGDQEVVVQQSAGVHQGFLDEAFRHGEAERVLAVEAAIKTTGAIIDRSVSL